MLNSRLRGTWRRVVLWVSLAKKPLFSRRNGARQSAAQMVIRGSKHKLHMTLRLPPGLIAAARLKTRLPSSPRGIEATLKAAKGGPVLTFDISISKRD